MSTHRNQWLGVLVLSFGAAYFALPTSAQTMATQPTPQLVSPASSIPTTQTQPTVTQNVTQNVNPADYILGQGDRISVRVFGADDWPDRPIDVSADDDIVAPLVGRVSVKGMTVRDLETNLTKQYAKFFKQPEVSVTVLEYRSQPVTVMGSVNTPGVIQLRRPTRLMEVISQAGGLKPDAGDKVLITRMAKLASLEDGPGKQKFTNQQFDLRKIMDGKDPAGNVLVQANDLISIPKAQMVYVVGEIGRPGGYILDGHSGTISVLQILALAGGVTKTAQTSAGRILRPSDENVSHHTEEKVDLKKILSNKAPDVELHADDILFVPNSAAKSAGLKSLEMAANIGTGLAIWRF